MAELETLEGSDCDCYGDAEVEASAAAAIEVRSDAGYSECSEVLMHDDDDDVIDVTAATTTPAATTTTTTTTVTVIDASPQHRKPPLDLYMEPGDSRVQSKVLPARRVCGKQSSAHNDGLNNIELSWRADMSRWSKFLRTAMEDHLMSLGGQQTEHLNLVCPFTGNWAEGFQALVTQTL